MPVSEGRLRLQPSRLFVRVTASVRYAGPTLHFTYLALGLGFCAGLGLAAAAVTPMMLGITLTLTQTRNRTATLTFHVRYPRKIL